MAAPRCDAEEAFPFADLTLRAGVDGTTVRVHRGVLATHSCVLRNVLTGTKDDTVPLPFKDGDAVKLLVAWLYRKDLDKTIFTRVSARGGGACKCIVLHNARVMQLSLLLFCAACRTTLTRCSRWRRSTTSPA